eukprot:10177513-Lingulodinium_polyedra.AAC.1
MFIVTVWATSLPLIANFEICLSPYRGGKPLAANVAYRLIAHRKLYLPLTTHTEIYASLFGHH